MKKHECNKQGWSTCTRCGGRIHLKGCTAKKISPKDCTLEYCKQFVKDSIGRK